MRILHVISAFHPATAFGGPIFSTHALCNALAGIDGVELKVLTTDTAGRSIHERVSVDRFPAEYPAGYKVYFTRRLAGVDISPGLLGRLGPLVRWADVVHVTGTYSFPTLPTLALCSMAGKPVVWSPRGALLASEQWQTASRPRLKRAFERVCRLAMPRRTVLHVTSEAELSASLARLPEAAGQVVPNGIELPAELPPRDWRPGGRLRAMFIGRLDPVKGLENLIEATALLPTDSTTLDIYGSGEEGYVASLVRLVADRRLTQRVRFHGYVADDEKCAAFQSADVCVLPSFTENFGMAVAEALAHGVPVVVSRGTPWPGVETHGCGRWVGNGSESLAAAIDGMRHEDIAAMGRRGREWMRAEYGWEQRAGEMHGLFEDLIRQGLPKDDQEPRNKSVSGVRGDQRLPRAG